MLDLKIINANLVDGTGAPGRAAEVGVRDGRIAAIEAPGKISEAARETIDADGKVLAPGFIDSHTHYDAQVFWDPKLSPSCFHGVTTVLGGFCGFSIAPLTPDSAKYLLPMLARVEGMPRETLEQGAPWDWGSFGDYLSRLEGKLGLNAGFYVGHSAVRRAVMGERALYHWSTEEELARMKALVGQSLAEGALGFSTTISPGHNDADGHPVPSRHASRDELLALAAVCSQHEGTGLELLPNTSFDPEVVELLTQFSLAGRRPVNWNAIIIRGSSAADAARVESMLAVSDHARARGAHVVALATVNPATFRVNLLSGVIFENLPGWQPMFQLPPAERIAKLRDPEYRRFLEERANSPGRHEYYVCWDRYTLLEAHSAKYQRFENGTLGEAARTLDKKPFDVLLDMAVDSGLKASFQIPTLGDDAASHALRGRVWNDERVIIGASDAGAHLDLLDNFAFTTKLLQTGVRDYGLMTMEEAVRQLTSVPAALFGIRERGTIREGWHADLVIFDPKTAAQSSPYTRFDLPGGAGRLYADAIGIDRVIVNGRVIVRDNVHTGVLPGKVLRSGRDTYTVPIPADRR